MLFFNSDNPFHSYPFRPVPAELEIVVHFPHDEDAHQTHRPDGPFQRRQVEADAERRAEPPGRQLVDFADMQFLVDFPQRVVHRMAGYAQVIGHLLLRGTPGDALGHLPLADGQCGYASSVVHTSVMPRRAKMWLMAS